MPKTEIHQRMLDGTQEPTKDKMSKFISDKDAIVAWNQIHEYIGSHYDLLREVKYFGDKYGWLVRYRKSGRTIVSFFPEKNSFTVLIIYGKKEIEKFSIVESEFLPAIVELFQNTKKLHDGKWLWIRITDSRYFSDLKRLIAIKRKPKKLL